MKELIIENIDGTEKHITAIKMEDNCIDAMLRKNGQRYYAKDIEGNEYIVYGWVGFAKRRGYKFENI